MDVKSIMLIFNPSRQGRAGLREIEIDKSCMVSSGKEFYSQKNGRQIKYINTLGLVGYR
jgi:hypothetical protein